MTTKTPIALKTRFYEKEGYVVGCFGGFLLAVLRGQFSYGKRSIVVLIPIAIYNIFYFYWLFTLEVIYNICSNKTTLLVIDLKKQQGC